MKIVVVTSFHSQERIENGMLMDTINSVRNLVIPEGAEMEYCLFSNGKLDDTKVLEAIKDFPFPVYYFHVPNNMGAISGGNVAFNVVLARNADFIQSVDSDDKLHPLSVSRALQRLAEGNLDMVGYWYQTFGNTNEILKWRNDLTLEKIVKDRVAPPCQMFYSRKCFELTGGFNTTLEYANDFELHIRLAMLGMKYDIIEEPLYFYRLHGNQETDGRYNDDEWKDKSFKLNGLM